jgi:hypothetical protein
MSSSTLFALLDTCLAADEGPPGFKAKIAIGVLEEDTTAWWVGDFGARASSFRTRHTPGDCDTVLLLGGEEATKLLEGRPLGRQPRTCSVIGDPRQLIRFNQRYLDRKGVVGIRLGAKR